MRAASDRVRVQTKSGEYQRSAVFRRTIWTKQRVASRQRSLQSRPGAPCCARRVGSDRAARRVRSRRTPLVLRRLNALAGHHERPHRSHPTMQGSSPNSPPPEVKQVTLTVLRNSTTHRDVTQLLTTPPVFRHDFTSRRHSSRVTRHQREIRHRGVDSSPIAVAVGRDVRSTVFDHSSLSVGSIQLETFSSRVMISPKNDA